MLSKQEFRSLADKEKQKYIEYIPIISKRLNKVHGLNEKDNYWEKVLGFSFLIHVAQCLHIFHLRNDKTAQELKYSIKEIIVPKNEIEYRDLYVNKGYGSQYLNWLINKGTKNIKFLLSDLKYKQKNKPFRIFQKIKKEGFLTVIIEFLSIILKKVSSPKIILNQVYWSQKKKHKIQFKSFFKVHHTFINIPFAGKSDLNYNFREQISCPEGLDDEFDRFFFASLKFAIPLSVVERFSSRKNAVLLVLKTYKKLKIIMNESLSEDANLISAEASKLNIKTYGIEHNYLQHQFVGNNLWFIRRKFDYFLSLGWVQKNDKNHIPASSNFNWSLTRKKPTIDVLYISTLAQKRFPHFSSGYGESGNKNSLSYLKMKKSFFKALNPLVLKKIYYRDYPNSGKEKLSERSINIKFNDEIKKVVHTFDDSDTTSAQSLMAKSSLVICDYLSTPYNSMLISNIPSIILFNKDTYYLVDSYKGVYDCLIKANIMFTNPLFASKFINEIHTQIDSWWYSKNVQDARDFYLNQNFGKNGTIDKYILSLS